MKNPFAAAFTMDRVLNGWRSEVGRAIKAGMIAGLFMALWTLFIPNKYRSEARVLSQDPRANSSISGLVQAAASFGMSVGSQGDASLIYVDILKSRWLAEKTLLKSYKSTHKKWYFGKVITEEKTLKEYFREQSMDLAVKKFKDNFEVDRDGKSGTISIRFTAPSQDLAQQITQQSVTLLEDFLVFHGQNQGSAKAVFATERMNEAIRESLDAEEDLARFSRENRGYQTSGDPEIRLKGQRLEFQLQMRRQVLSSVALSREQALMDQKDNTPIITVLDRGNLPVEKSKPWRSLMVVMAGLIVGGCRWVWPNRRWLKESFL